MWKLPKEGYELTSGFGRTFIFIVLDEDTEDEDQ